jgi:hypothetical protein
LKEYVPVFEAQQCLGAGLRRSYPTAESKTMQNAYHQEQNIVEISNIFTILEMKEAHVMEQNNEGNMEIKQAE